jgi:hypothetical protein
VKSLSRTSVLIKNITCLVLGSDFRKFCILFAGQIGLWLGFISLKNDKLPLGSNFFELLNIVLAQACRKILTVDY